MSQLPSSLTWLFWDIDADLLDLAVHFNTIVPRILEFGGISEVRWMLATYELGQIHAFFARRGAPRTQ